MKYDWIAGTGGIGKGEIFRLVGNKTLEREESRSAVLTPYRDYCKLHIILSYAARLLGTEIPVFALGRVGADERGKQLLHQMRRQGFRTEFVKETDAPTKYSVCFLYENGEGGNITSCNDACSLVTETELVNALNSIIREHGRNGIILGAPEVPLNARLALLRAAKREKIYTVCSVLADEAEKFLAEQGAAVCDLIAVNAAEAAALSVGAPASDVLRAQNKEIRVIITKGRDGCDLFFDNTFVHFDALPIQPVSTAGAGDALLGGVLIGLAEGSPLYSDHSESALELGILLASYAVASQDTIPEVLNKRIIQKWRKNFVDISEDIVSSHEKFAGK